MTKAGRWHARYPRRLPDASTWEERLALVRSSWEFHPFWRLLGVEVVGLGPGYGKVHVTMDKSRHGDWPHGGLMSSMVDMSVAMALFTTYGPEDEDVVAHATSDLNVTFLDAVEGRDLFAEGRIVRRARLAAFGTSEVRDGADRLVALGRATFLIRRQAPDAAD